MSRTNLPLESTDISAFARSLRAQIGDLERTPSHLELLNMLARSAGFRNFQHLRAQTEARGRVEAKEATAPAADYAQVERLLRHFDAKGRLVIWPGKASQRELCLWALWSRIPARRVLSEPALNKLLNAEHLFNDAALLRRDLCDGRMVSRTADGREYRRVERRPPPEAAALIHVLAARRSA